MALFNPHQLRGTLAAHARLLGIDPGSKTIGIALSDVSRMLASPFGVIRRDKLGRVADEIARIVARHDVGGIVTGLPLSLDGGFGPAARAAQDWTEALSERLGLAACVWDERLSSSAVNRFLIADADMTRKRRAAVVDKMAAAYTLQSYLDATRDTENLAEDFAGPNGGRNRD